MKTKTAVKAGETTVTVDKSKLNCTTNTGSDGTIFVNCKSTIDWTLNRI